MKIINIIGWSGSGKTTLVLKLINELKNRNKSISTMKHAHHDFEIDKPGKDSYKHRSAGAREVLISSSKRWALISENNLNSDINLQYLISRIKPVDVLIIEGWKYSNLKKIEVYRPELGKPRITNNSDNVVAIATNSENILISEKIPIFNLNDVNSICDFILKLEENIFNGSVN